jgi:sulfatase modifying factor 1
MRGVALTHRQQVSQSFRLAEISELPVGGLLPNGWGLYDMSGNVFEAVWDQRGREYYSTSPGVDPEGADEDPAMRIVRGGSYDADWNKSRVSYRSEWTHSR